MKRISQILLAVLIPFLFYFMLSASKVVRNENTITVSVQPEADIVSSIINNKYPAEFEKIKKPGKEETEAYENSRIFKLACGERLIYEAEIGYKHTEGRFINDSGRTVLFPRGMSYNGSVCICSGMNDKIILKRGSVWHLKPMMRIRKKDFVVTDMTPVAAIVVTNGSERTIDSVVIKIRSFCDESGNYNGEYKDKFTFEVNLGSLCIANRTNEILVNNIDVKIYWFGLVDVWFDKLTVDEEIADRLLSTDMGSCYDFLIIDETTPEMFLYIAIMVKEKRFIKSNYPCINHVMNVMFNKLQNQAVPISLKSPD